MRYDIIEDAGRFYVYAGSDRASPVSDHRSIGEAREAIKRYRAADKRRDQQVADHVDGYDRDDLGESPDY